MERIITCLNKSYGLGYCVPKRRTQEGKAQAINQKSKQIKEKGADIFNEIPIQEKQKNQN